MPKTTSDVSSRNTKQEILDAYQQLVQELSHQDSKESKSVIKENEPEKNKTIITQNPEKIISHLGEMRIEINKKLNDIVDNLVGESEKFNAMQEEAELIRGEISTMYQIKVHASTLKNILALIDKTRNEEQERQSEVQKQRERENDQYLYLLKMKRQKEEDEYHEKRKLMEAQLVDREQRIKEKEDEYIMLKKQVAELQKLLETELMKVRKETAEAVRKDLETKYTLEQTEAEGEEKVSKIMIQNLEKTIKSEEQEIRELKSQLSRTTEQIKEIAVSVIESKKPITLSPAQSKES